MTLAEKNEQELQRLQAEQKNMMEEQERLRKENNREQEGLNHDINLERLRNAELATRMSNIQQQIVHIGKKNETLQSKIHEANENYIQKIKDIHDLDDNDANKADQIVQLEFQRREDQNMIMQNKSQIRTNTDQMGTLRRQMKQLRLPSK